MYSTGMHIMYYNYDIHFILSGINTAQIGQYATHCRMARHTRFHLALPSTSQDLSAEGTSSASSKSTAHSLLIAKIEPHTLHNIATVWLEWYRATNLEKCGLCHLLSKTFAHPTASAYQYLNTALNISRSCPFSSNVKVTPITALRCVVNPFLAMLQNQDPDLPVDVRIGTCNREMPVRFPVPAVISDLPGPCGTGLKIPEVHCACTPHKCSLKIPLCLFAKSSRFRWAWAYGAAWVPWVLAPVL